jgi:hypothetical protein
VTTILKNTALKQQIADDTFSDIEASDYGKLIECSNDVYLNASFNIKPKYPIKWTGVVECKFENGMLDINTKVHQLSADDWEHIESFASEKES